MTDLLCCLMGIADIIAGGIIIFSLEFNAFSVIFGGVMVVKGGISFL